MILSPYIHTANESIYLLAIYIISVYDLETMNEVCRIIANVDSCIYLPQGWQKMGFSKKKSADN